MKASEYYKTKPVNVVNQVWHKDGTVDITIYKHGWNKPHAFKAKSLDKPDEEILNDEEVTEEKTQGL